MYLYRANVLVEASIIWGSMVKEKVQEKDNFMGVYYVFCHYNVVQKSSLEKEVSLLEGKIKDPKMDVIKIAGKEKIPWELSYSRERFSSG